MTHDPSDRHNDASADKRADTEAQTDSDHGATPATDATPPLRRIRSFVTRAGRLSNAQRRALDELGPRFKLPYTGTPLDWETTFGRDAPRVLEIGFGMGTTTADIAAQRPGDDFLGIEVHEPGVGALLKLIGERQLNNIRVIQHDAVEVIEHMLAEDSVDGVHIFFPDPWHKARHHKRRLIQPPLVKLLASRLRAGGYLHLATDWQNYAEQMLDVLRAESTLVNASDEASGYAPRPDYRPVTKFERRGLRLGHGVWDLLFTKR
ncbi:tRNA (guanosine(46)-N7)-methyltransferase TrmB [Mycetohabitans sp. B8]|uniref:tRNA (guanosine(46)-N7)-methyltransferase TrmB n=1 Tax=Mycetohabitans sp. B8 TaxID=2841845 RepID=UPI001F0161B6|nr:tRNA (guanosine(46)-N7)-methyltransferase TrmB [Mycetohabitans sp. B8]MCG1043139.1 tRNA (guanosine(46)-N7)-methyltransferase TrmB [Mycetohabitans sp. B8]